MSLIELEAGVRTDADPTAFEEDNMDVCAHIIIMGVQSQKRDRSPFPEKRDLLNVGIRVDRLR